jgi:biopolymer transport protein ExbB/TolQ
VLAPATAPEVLAKLHSVVDSPRHFVLFHRFRRGLSNLRNIGMISDVSEILRSQAESDEDHMESSYSLVRGLVWAIPVLGFIGTVLGLSQSIGTFGTVLSAGGDMGMLKGSLQKVVVGLSVAFDTTLVALVAALGIQLCLTTIKKKEEAFLDACKEYCHTHLIGRLRLIRIGDSK